MGGDRFGYAKGVRSESQIQIVGIFESNRNWSKSAYAIEQRQGQSCWIVLLLERGKDHSVEDDEQHTRLRGPEGGPEESLKESNKQQNKEDIRIIYP